MDVSCPQCETVYELDEGQVRAKAVTLKCSQCHHLFRLIPPSVGGDESQRRWMVKKIESGDILYFNSFDTLHEWIMAGTIGERDEISRTGRSWKALGEIGEFMPIFKVVASIASLSKSSSADDETVEMTYEALAKSARTRAAPDGDSSPDVRAKNSGGPKSSTARQRRPKSPTPAPQPTGEASRAKAEKPRRPRHDSTPPPMPKKGEQKAGRKRKSTQPQYQTGKQQLQDQPRKDSQRRNRPAKRSATPSTPPANTSRNKEKKESTSAPRRMPPEPNRPARKPETTPGPEPSSRTPQTTPTPQTSSPKKEKSPSTGAHGDKVQLDGRRFQHNRDDGTTQPDESASEPTLGELEYGDPEAPVVEMYQRKRRWPLLVAFAIVVGVGVGIWQHETVKEWLPLDDDSVAQAPSTDPESDEPEAEPSQVASAQLVEGVDAALAAAKLAVHSLAYREALEAGKKEVGVALTDAQRSAEQAAQRAAVPLPQRLIASGRRSLDRGNATQALQRFQQALDASPDNAEAIVGLGWAHLSDGSIELAISKFERAIAIDSSMGEALIGMGRAERNRGQSRAALTAYERYLDRFPNGEHASIARYQSEQLRQNLDE